ncbi:MAG: DUF1566 domain-containing protein [Desulfuromonadaceae bacterium]|nr:DUF1566 domain-containing protein [Desulfuromonadaceae bacterium]MDD2854413.1 DUF1566 domain-containing protein [Desulfuromonadaceae bacterium]
MRRVMIRITKGLNLAAIILLPVGAWATSPPAPLPHTGQTECWDTSGALTACIGTGQDGELRGGVAWPSPRFTDNGDLTMTDSLTGLIWTKDANLMMTRDPAYDINGPADGKVTWLSAISYVKKLNTDNYLGYNDWRLPNRNELESMINKQKPDQSTWLNSQGFNNIWADGYWSSGAFYIPNSYYSYYQWFVNMGDGTVDASHNSFTYSVWPVRSGQVGTLTLPKTGIKACLGPSGSVSCAGTGQDGELQIGAAWPTPRFIVNSDQTVTDTISGLAWSREASSPGPSACKPNESMSWQNALNYVMCLNTNNFLGYNDWRLPNRNELASLIHQGEINSVTWLTSNGFTDVGYYTLQSFWSSSTYAASPTKAWIAVMDYGYLRTDIKTDPNNFVWPVRGGQTGPPGDIVVPAINSFVVPATSTSLTVPVTAFTASDNTDLTGYCLSKTNIVADCIWSATPQTSYTFPSEGIKNLYAFAIDAALNVSAVASAAVTITLPDTTKPVVTAFTIPTTSTTLSVGVSTLTATDNVAVTGYLITQSASPSVTSPNWSTTAPTSYTFTGISDGIATSRILYAFAKDAVGNISDSSAVSVTITLPDVTKPVITSFSVPSSGTSLTIAVTTITATDNVALTGYLITESATTPLVTATGWSATKPTSFTFTGISDGIATNKTLYAWAKDAAGNISNSATATTAITLPDVTKPVITAFTVSTSGTTLSVPVSTLSATDNVAVTGYFITESAIAPLATASGWSATQPATYTFTGISDGIATNKTLYAWAKDAVGNVSLSKSASVIVTLPDTTVPVVTALTIPATSTSLIVPISTLTATDNIAVTEYLLTETSSTPTTTAPGWSANKPANYTFTTDGSKTLYAWAKDAVGIISTSMSATVTVDTTSPTLTLSTLSSGAVTKDATLNISGTASDINGIASLTINNATVTITNDNFSYPVTLQTGGNIITTIVTDTLGNSTTDIRTITLDITAPILTISAPADNSKTALPTATITGTINESSTVTVKVNNGSPQSASITGTSFEAAVNLVSGLNTITITATDLALNTSSAVRTVIYDNTKPALAITAPDQDVTTAVDRLTISGTVSDALSDATVSISFNNQSFPQTVTNGAFSQLLVFPGEGTWVVTATATDQVGNSSTTSRNIIYSIPVNGVCGSSNGLEMGSAPTVNLCETGTASAVSGNYPWSWSCEGANGGTTAICSTSEIVYLIPGDCDNSGTVTIAEVQSAINMFLGLKTVEACVDTGGDNHVSIAEVQKTINSFLGL